MLSAKEEKYMETKTATIERGTPHSYLVLEVGAEPLKIILTEDNPNNIKATFNSLLKELKSGLFKFNLVDATPDLFQNICVEYIMQLNTELSSVYTDLETMGLLTPSEAAAEE